MPQLLRRGVVQADRKHGLVDGTQGGGVGRVGRRERRAQPGPFVARERREIAHARRARRHARRRHDRVEGPLQLRGRHRVASLVEQVDRPNGAAPLHHHMPRVSNGAQFVPARHGHARRPEQVGVLRHVQRVRAGGGGAVEGHRSREAAHHLGPKRVLGAAGHGVENVGLEHASLEGLEEEAR
eukprot:scaffold4156_cov101-Isochrysis_galbana.AAC.3